MLQIISIMCAILIVCEASSLTDSLSKCGINEGLCHIKNFEITMNMVAENGSPEMNIPPLDPYNIKNVGIVILGLIKATMVDGTAKGFKNCKVENETTDLVKHRSSIHFICENIIFDGHYKIEKTPALSAFVGNLDIHGEGYCTIQIKKYLLNLSLDFKIKKLDDGELHFEVTPDSTYTYEILDKIIITANNLYIGKQEISDVAVKILNENWDVVGKTLGNTIIDEILKVLIDVLNNFYSRIPANQLIADDLLPYVA